MTSIEEQLAYLRGRGWTVAVHNDYRLDTELHTFWLFTHSDGRWVKGENVTDFEALKIIIEKLSAFEDDAYIEDGFGSQWDKVCAECDQPTLEVVRPGKVQCVNCG